MSDLSKKKLEKMIRDVLKGKLDLPKEAFQTLLKAYESVSNQEINLVNKPVSLTPPTNLNPPRTINIRAKNVFIVKDNDFSEVVKELETNEFFLRRKAVCEVY